MLTIQGLLEYDPLSLGEWFPTFRRECNAVNFKGQWLLLLTLAFEGIGLL